MVKQRERARAAQLLRWLPACALMGALFYLSHQSSPLGRSVTSLEGGLAHVAAYFGLAVLVYWPLSASAREPGLGWLTAGLAFALTALYGLTDEVHQAFVPGRVASETDLALDAAGAALGVAAALLLPNLRAALRSVSQRLVPS